MPEGEARPGPDVRVHRAPLPRGVAEAAARVLAEAFEGEPSSIGDGAGPAARYRLMRVPVDACARDGGLVVATVGERHDVGGPAGTTGAARPPGGDGVLGVSAWLPGARRGGGTGRVLGTGSWLLLPLLGPRALLRAVREADETDRLVSRYVGDDDAYLWIVGVRQAGRGRGVGRRLVHATVEDARVAGHARVVLVTHQPRNVAVYRAMGFHLVDTARSRGGVVHVMARTT